MTTIVVSQRQKIMVSDSVATGGGPPILVSKIYEVDGKLVGFAGSAAHGLKFIEWLRHGTVPIYAYEKEENTFDALVLSHDGLVYYDKELVALEIHDDITAIGSGCEYAIGAIDAGATLKRAVEIAAGRDTYSGLPVVVKKLPRKRK